MSEQTPSSNADLKNILSRLLSFDTTSRESNLELIQFIKEYLDSHDIGSTLINNDDGSKANLYARIGPTGDGGVMLSGHTDVVPVDDQDWNFPAFGLTEEAGRYYGRGSADMKGFIACVLAEIPNFQATELAMPLHLAFSYDEEVGCLGVRSLIEYLHASPEKPAMCIIGEPTQMKPVFGHKGKVAMRCHVQGKACHSAYAPDGVNAIEYAAKLINKITKLSEPLKQQRDDRFDPPYSTLQTGVIQGGAALNIVPESCQFDFEMRFLPSADYHSVINEVQQYAKKTLEPEMQSNAEQSAIRFESLSSYPALLTDQQSLFAQNLTDWVNSSDFGTVAFGTEGGLFDEAGVATLVCGPGSMSQGHKPNEYVEIEQLDKCRTMLKNLCGWISL